MSVKKFIQPTFATEASGNTYAAKIEDALAVLASSQLGHFAPYASSPPDLSINISPSNIKNEFGIALGGMGLVIGAAQETNVSVTNIPTVHTILVMPTVSKRIDRLYFDVFQGILRRVAGVESDNPIAPAYPESAIPICQVQLSVGQTMITNMHITDERGMVGNDSPMAGIGGVSTVFGNAVGYEIFDVAGTYSFSKPANARFYRLTISGAGGGGGGDYVNSTLTISYSGGGGGAGANVNGLMMLADDLQIVVGLAGLAGTPSSPGVNNATVGVAGGDTTITKSSGEVLTIKGGSPGGRATSTPSYGTAGVGGVASLGGTAGGNGEAATTTNYVSGGGRTLFNGGAQFHYNTPAKSGNGGAASFPGADGFIMIEWF